MRGKRLKGTITAALLVVLVILGISRVKFQSVYEFRHDAEAVSSELGLTTERASESAGTSADRQAAEAQKAGLDGKQPGMAEGGEPAESEKGGADKITKNRVENADGSAGGMSTEERKRPVTDGSAGGMSTEERIRPVTDGSAGAASDKANTRERKSKKAAAVTETAADKALTGKSEGQEKGRSKTADLRKKSTGKSEGQEKASGHQEKEAAGKNGGSKSDISDNETSDRREKSAETEKAVEETSGKSAADPQEEKLLDCSLEILCPKLWENRESADEAVLAYIPEDGKLLERVTVHMKKGDSAYDLLEAVCKAKGIALDAVYTPMYSSYYVRGIGNIYEKQAGEMSGWVYTVNGRHANVGASAYRLKEGELISFRYTCDGRSS